MSRAVEQIVLVRAHRRQGGEPVLVDMDVAGGAAAAAAAQSEQLVEAVVADILHHRPADAALDRPFVAAAGENRELRHIRVRTHYRRWPGLAVEGGWQGEGRRAGR